MQTVYIDVLLCVNLIINYLLLSAVGFYTHTKVTIRRLLSGAGVGAVCSLTILLPKLSFFPDTALKLAVGSLTVISAYGIKPFKSFVRLYAVFLTATFFFGGIMIALWYVFTPKDLIIKNSVIYLNISPIKLIMCSVICYMLFKIFHTISGRHDTKETVCILTVKQDHSAVRVKALVDTGNCLKEPFSQSPVVIIMRSAAHSIIPKAMREYECVTTLKYRENFDNIRIVPFTSVGCKGIMPCFKPHELFINDILCDRSVYVALCDDEYISGDYQAIVPSDIM